MLPTADSIPQWSSPPSDDNLYSSEAHIWRFSLDQPSHYAAKLKKLLSPDEIKRADSFHFEYDRVHYEIAHSLLRVILCFYLDVPPVSLQFDYSPSGKPCLHSYYCQKYIRFNISHSKDLGVVAVTKNREIGVDIEAIRRIDYMEGMGRFLFSPAEARLFSLLSGDDRIKYFFLCWVRKEAVFKARGTGISDELNQITVSNVPDSSEKVITLADSRGCTSQWFLQDLELESSYLAAYCIEGKECHLSRYHITDSELINLL